MADLIEKIRTAKGDLQIDYNALANLPTVQYVLDDDGTLRVALKAAEEKIYQHRIYFACGFDESEYRLPGWITVYNTDPTPYTGSYSEEGAMSVFVGIGASIFWRGSTYTIEAVGEMESPNAFTLSTGSWMEIENKNLLDVVTEWKPFIIIDGKEYQVTQGMQWSELTNANYMDLPISSGTDSGIWYYGYDAEGNYNHEEYYVVWHASDIYPPVETSKGLGQYKPYVYGSDIIDTSATYFFETSKDSEERGFSLFSLYNDFIGEDEAYKEGWTWKDFIEYRSLIYPVDEEAHGAMYFTDGTNVYYDSLSEGVFCVVNDGTNTAVHLDDKIDGSYLAI